MIRSRGSTGGFDRRRSGPGPSGGRFGSNQRPGNAPRPNRSFEPMGSFTPAPPDALKLNVVHLDDWLVVVDKPAGVIVNMAERDEVTLQDQVRRELSLSVLTDAVPAAAVHRIDRYTSGLVVFGRCQTALDRMSELLRDGKLHKTYFALAIGVVGEVEERGVIDMPLRETPDKRRRMTLWRPGQDQALDAKTEWRVREVFSSDASGVEATMLELKPLTGRTHQLRVHLHGIGHPIAGDKIHGDKGANRALRERLGLERQFLHARQLEFIHPMTGAEMSLISPLDDELMGIVRRLRNSRMPYEGIID